MRLLLNQRHAGIGVREKYRVQHRQGAGRWFCRVAASFNEVLEQQGEVRNHTSMLRVACAVYLQNRSGVQLAV